MQGNSDRRRGIGRATAMIMLAGMVAACADQSGGPAPVYLRGGPTMGAAGPTAPAAPVAPIHREARQARQITVERGQSVDKIAHANHVTPAAIIAANHLKHPYALKAGSRLLIPDAGPAPTQVAAAPSPAPQPVPAMPLAPPPAQAATAPPQNLAPQPQQAALTPPQSASKALPDVVPLDGPAPKETAAAPQPRQAAAEPSPPPPAASGGAPPVLAPRNAAAALPLPGETPVDPVAAGSGRFAWPVQGRVLAGYGAASNGGRNDGINIAAARGTPVHAIDSGTVAYVGNEVKGYGNLVLVKHDNGWISAYAHLDDPMVKVGQKIGSGQVIAKVGNSGGVGQPQLHFELRRGKQPVDPREFLAPAPSAGGPGNKAG